MTCEKSKGTLTVMKDNKDEEIKYDVYILQKPSDKCKKKKEKMNTFYCRDGILYSNFVFHFGLGKVTVTSIRWSQLYLRHYKWTDVKKAFFIPISIESELMA